MVVEHSRVDRTSAMGATVWPDGTGFRTWAPSARAVSLVAGARLSAAAQDPAWRPDQRDSLAPLGDGSWGGFLAGLGDGEPYMFFIDGAGSTGWKRDPFARELTIAPAFPDSFCIVRDHASYPWHDQAWRPPPYNDLIIYQQVVG
jgi:1,4-alpha-glucan branching enzyme